VLQYHFNTNFIIMALTATIRARVDENLKIEAQKVLDEIGISASQLINMMLTKLVAKRDIPFETKTPTPRLQQAIDEMNNGETVIYTSIEEMMNDLKS